MERTMERGNGNWGYVVRLYGDFCASWDTRWKIPRPYITLYPRSEVSLHIPICFKKALVVKSHEL